MLYQQFWLLVLIQLFNQGKLCNYVATMLNVGLMVEIINEIITKGKILFCSEMLSQ